ncbi:hypothetical protein GCM10018793_58630 [Streptomyces sulfonofaciens]|uniref:HTH araC/xylS-type domain-containing protein n=1 Tax=Streptomyces sulfonofaciens TaxID=68272 RepID=A0A919L7P5_9ACTN|nr:hypothetical protein GCM10018793_58630 [Streptomyces sulfonofaciens]
MRAAICRTRRCGPGPFHRIAARWDFGEHATPTRSFTAAYGMPPREYRHRAPETPPGDDPPPEAERGRAPPRAVTGVDGAGLLGCVSRIGRGAKTACRTRADERGAARDQPTAFQWS